LNQQVYNGLHKTPSVLRSVSITTLNLNKQPIPKQPVPDLKQTAERYLRYMFVSFYLQVLLFISY